MSDAKVIEFPVVTGDAALLAMLEDVVAELKRMPPGREVRVSVIIESLGPSKGGTLTYRRSRR